MIIESNYTLNSELEVIHENTNLVIVDEVNNIVHFNLSKHLHIRRKWSEDRLRK